MNWRPKVFIVGGLMGCVLLYGCCARCPRSAVYDLSQTNFCQQVQEAFNSSSVVDGELCGQAWWIFFQDAQLNTFIELSLACHPTIKIAEARVRLACQEAKIERSALLPHISGFANVQREEVSHFGTDFFTGKPSLFTETTIGLASSVYELDIWQKNRSRYYAALDEMKAQAADYEEVKLLLSTSIASVYFNLQMNLAQLEVTKERIEAREELYTLLKQQFDRGIISEYRLYETDTEVQLLKDFYEQLRGEIQVNKNTLAALVGNVACLCGVSGELEVAPSAHFEGAFPLPCSLSLDLLARRPDITAQKWLIEASCYDVKVARAQFYPSIDLIGLASLQSIHLADLFTGKAFYGVADALGLLPLFTAGKLKAQLGVAQETLEMAIESYNQTVLVAVRQVSDAFAHLKTADLRERNLLHAIQDAQSLFQLTQQKFENGISNKIAVLNSIENVLGLQDLEIQVKLNRYQAAVELIRAIGGGYYDCI
ncbi:MAG: Antibiotic efflux pump outer membrane protein ArpC [Chlamydiales bacterium]|nr:Antibiotic efflux pump outer membrane protein ArpC [Chlamydiales bacterium]